MKTREEILKHLFSLHRLGAIKYDLARMHEACKRLDNPQSAYPCIHVAGTNGKGSVCSMIESILRVAGRHTGLFIKPHLVDFEERFLIDGAPISAEEWLDVHAMLEEKVSDLDLSFFELSTLVAFEVFRRRKVEWAVFETGMGGRLDATSVVRPVCSVITSIGMDHMEWLGSTLKEIAGEKLGIVKEGTPVVMARPSQPEIQALAEQVCAGKHAPLRFLGEQDASDVRQEPHGSSFLYDNTAYRVPLAGRHQAGNALLAIEAACYAGVRDPGVLTAGIAATFVPGRFQEIETGGTVVVFDVAHNPQAGEALTGSLRARFTSGQRLCLVVGMMRDKDIAGFLAHVAPVAYQVICTRPDIPRACPVDELSRMLPDSLKPCEKIVSVKDAVARGLGSGCDAVCVTGSFYTVGEAMTALGIRPYNRR